MGPDYRKPATWALGTSVAGRYRLEALLGAGGFGAVFRAFDLHTQTPVAIKLLTRSAMLHPDAVPRFHREARLAMSFRHPSTVRVFDSGDAGEGTPYITFELLEGVSVEERLAAGPIPVEEAVAIASAVLGSLEEAHAHHVIHRDVKPANVFLCASPRGAVKLLDFGVAQEAPPGSSMEKLTREGTMVGTPAYMAPEQLAGQPAGPGTDFFALGLVLAEMIQREPVYQGDALPICLAKLNGQPPVFRANTIPISLLAVLRRATAIDLHDRFRTADQMRQALIATGLMSGRASVAPPQPQSGKFGTQVMELPRSSTPPRVSALAATSPPSMNTPLAVGAALPRGGFGATTPLGGESSRRISALAATAPPSIANPLAATNPDAPRPAGKNPLLAATVDDPEAASVAFAEASRRSAALQARRGAPASIPLPPRSAHKKRSSFWTIAALVAFGLMAAAGIALWLRFRRGMW